MQSRRWLSWLPSNYGATTCQILSSYTDLGRKNRINIGPRWAKSYHLMPTTFALSDFYSILAMMHSMTVLTDITSTVSKDLSSVRCTCTVEQTESRLFVLYIPTELTKEARQCLHEPALQAEGKRTPTSCQEASNDTGRKWTCPRINGTERKR